MMLRAILICPKAAEDGPVASYHYNRYFLQIVHWWLRPLLFTIPLVVPFIGMLILQGIEIAHDKYYVPLMDRATRTDDDLREEMTYYHRTCTAADITTQDATDILVNIQGPVALGVDQIMTHGALVIPQLLLPKTVQQLRDYAVYRNRVIPQHEQYPVSQGHLRLSFGYDATEHFAVTQAVREVTRHPYLQPLLAALLGDQDPASTEITTITQYYGAGEMYWHPDTKPVGNAVKYARTYSPSFSLFVSLQNTTQAMGATEFCLGSHYCADDNLAELCRNHAVGLHSATPEQVFRSGDGALFNQHVWHAAPPHVDPHAPERIMFILSFLARPKPLLDQRQLSRGTYFHQKWNMWGHTWRDLMDPTRYMSRPYSYLKCLGLWTPAGRSWGYDLVTATIMRFSNNQLGSDLTRLVHIWDDILQWPTWLHGSNWEYQVEQKEAWQIFIQETIYILKDHLQRLTLVIHVLYGLMGFGLWAWTFQRRSRPNQWKDNHWALRMIRSSFVRCCWTHGTVVALYLLSLHWMENSEWGKGILMGQILKRPFPTLVIPSEEEERVQTLQVQGTLTTLPMANDVLLGTRFDAPWMGAYERWLDYHPGNRQYLQALQDHGPWFVHYHNCSALQTAIIHRVKQGVVQDGARFLRQDFRTGDWRILPSTGLQQDETVTRDLVFASSPLLQDVDRLLKRMIAFYRFTAFHRESLLARKSVVYLTRLQERLTTSLVAGKSKQPPPPSPRTVQSWRLLGPSTNPPKADQSSEYNVETFHSVRKFHFPSLGQQGIDPHQFFPVGYPVWFRLFHREQNEWVWYKGDVLNRHDEDHQHDPDNHNVFHYTIGLEAHGVVVSSIYPEDMRRYKPVEEGDVVMGCFEEYLEDCYPAQVQRVMADGSIHAMLMVEDDEDEEEVFFTFQLEDYYKPVPRRRS